MSVKNAAFVVAPTSIAATGGTALTFSDAGTAPLGAVDLIVTADTDFRTRRKVSIRTKSPKISATAPNGYTQQRTSAKFFKPKLLANTKITVNSVEVIVSYDVETTQTEIQELMDVGAQMLFDTDMTALWKAGNVS